MKKIKLLIILFVILLNVSLVLADIKITDLQYNPDEISPDGIFPCQLGSTCYTLDETNNNLRRVYQKYNFSNISEPIAHAYISVRHLNNNIENLNIQGIYNDDGVWDYITWNNKDIIVTGNNTLLFSEKASTFPLNTWQNQTYDFANLINNDNDKTFTVFYKWENESLSIANEFLLYAQIEYELDCVNNWTCNNWTLCQETQIKECNQVIDLNSCGEEYLGDYSEFGYPSCCYEDWSPQYNSCELNNTQIKYYTDDNSCNTTEYLPFDNNTEVACNFCQPDLEFIEEQCLWNGTSYFTYTSWEDNNYYSCCAITGEEDDCLFDISPYNESNTSLCVDAVEQFELQIDENVFLKPYERDDKVYATIWLNDTTQVYTCQSYVKTLDGYGIKDKRVIQINPVYEAKEKSLISLDTRTYEDREFFETNKGQATIYYTKENIVVDGRPYLFGVECVGNQTGDRVISEKVAYISYGNINEPVTLMFWINENTWVLVWLFFALIIIAIAIGFAVKHINWR